MTGYLNEHLPPALRSLTRPRPLYQRRVLKRDETANDFEEINWQALLAGGDEPPTLDFEKSDRRFLEAGYDDFEYRRLWDIDSFFFGISSLGVHRDGFELALRPPFLRRITQNPRVTIHGLPLHQTKQLRLGYGVADAGWDASTHVFFPHLAVKEDGSTHLSDEEQQRWVDDILRPALRRTCGHHIRQHWPKRFDDADYRARVKGESGGQRTGHAIDTHYTIPAARADAFWKAVVARSERHPLFRGLVLVIQAHNLKLKTQEAHPDTMR